MINSFGQHLSPIKPSPPMPNAPFQWRLDVEAGSGLKFWRTRYSADWSCFCEGTEESLAIGFLTAGAADIVVGTRSARRTPSNVALMPLRSFRYQKMQAVDGSYASVALIIDASVIAKVLMATFEDQLLSKLDLPPVLDLSIGVGQTLHLMCRTIVSGMQDRQLLKRSPKAMALLVEAALRVIFENVPHRMTGLLDRHPLDLAERHVKRAIDYMNANLHMPLMIIDVADAIGISERSLQLGFRKLRNTTPAAYLRQIRLQAVHAELSLPENKLPVHEVALKWGFSHMGRFAAQYRATFGTYPSATLKRTLACYSGPDAA